MDQTYTDHSDRTEGTGILLGRCGDRYGGESPRIRGDVLRRSVVGVFTALAVLLAVLPGAEAAAPGADDSARLGAGWLRARLEEQIPLDLFGSSDWGVTLDAVTALAAVDGSDPMITTAWEEIVAHRDEIVSDGSDDVAGSLAKLVLLAHAIGEDPRAVGDDPGGDLVSRLEATLQPGGLYGVQFAGYDGVYRQGLAITALVAAGAEPDPEAIAWLIGQQCTNAGFEGSYMPYRADTTVDCADDPDNWLGADTNATAMATAALAYAAADDGPAADAIGAALEWLAAVRDAGGGWASNSWSAPDANSTAVVIQMLVTVGELDADRFNTGGATPQQFLMGLQITESDEPGDIGAFNFMAGPDDPNLLATVQAVMAVASTPLIFEAPVTDDPTPEGSDDGEVDETNADPTTTPESGTDVPVPTERPIGFTG